MPRPNAKNSGGSTTPASATITIIHEVIVIYAAVDYTADFLFRQKTVAATMIAPTVNQFTPIHVLRSRCTRKIGLYSAANAPKTQTQGPGFFHALKTPNTRRSNSKSIAIACRNCKGALRLQRKRASPLQPAKRCRGRPGQQYRALSCRNCPVLISDEGYEKLKDGEQCNAPNEDHLGKTCVIVLGMTKAWVQ